MNTPTPSMNPEVKAEWLTALRSGRYEQIRKSLHLRGGGYCCLGVLCEITRLRTGLEWKKEMPSLFPDSLEMGNSYAYPPDEVLDVIGFREFRQDVFEVLSALATYNDIGEDFLKIADRIERNL